jgi:hypothetical protein
VSWESNDEGLPSENGKQCLCLAPCISEGESERDFVMKNWMREGVLGLHYKRVRDKEPCSDSSSHVKNLLGPTFLFFFLFP